MFGLPIGLLIRLAAALAVAAALAFLWHKFTGHYVDQGRAEVQAEWDADKARRVALTTAITLEWDKKRQEAEKEANDHDRVRTALFEPVAVASRNLPATARGIRVPGAVAGLLDDAARRATDAPAAARTPDKATPADPADTTVGILTDWAVVVLELDRQCRDRLREWTSFYEGLRAEQSKTLGGTQ